MSRLHIIGCLTLLTCLALFIGCRTTDKTVQKPDPFEKWRILAEQARGNSPGPRAYDAALPPVPEETKRSQDAAAIAEKKIPMPIMEKKLPTMPVTMKMNDVPVAVLLRSLARVADMNIMINESVTGTANINIKNLPWDKAFKGLLNTYGLIYQWSDEILRVVTVEDLNREIELMEAQQKFEKSKKEHSIAMMAFEQEREKLDPLITRIVKIDYADLAPLRENLEKYLISGRKELELSQTTSQAGADGINAEPLMRGAILMNETTNSLIIQATAADIAKIMPIIRKLDKPSEQILIEAHIVETNSDTARELGIQWGGLGLRTSGSGNNTWIGGPIGALTTDTENTSGGFPTLQSPGIGPVSNFPSSENAGTAGWEGMTLGIIQHNIGNYLLYAQLTALQEDGKLNILSKPSITTMDHRKATIESGREVPYQTIEDGDTKIEFKKAVIKLEVTPHVINNQVIRLDILTHKDELDWTRTVAGNPTIITKNAETKVNLFDGQTTVIGGLNKELVQDSESGVPFLKDIPGLGTLFKSNSDSQNMEELLIFITPHILKERPVETVDQNG